MIDYSLQGARDYADLEAKADARIKELIAAWREAQAVAEYWRKRFEAFRVHGVFPVGDDA